MKRVLLLSILLAATPYAVAQHFSRAHIPVEINGKQLKNPWAGGLNSPQFSAADLNDDGKTDLYIFDRSGNAHLTFLNEGTAAQPDYIYAPLYGKFFPKANNFAMLRDYNQDGIMDLFAHALDEGIAGYKVYKGKYHGGALKFNRVKFNDYEFDVLHFPDDGMTNFIYTSKVDFPAIDDIDGDGDLDLLANQGDSHVAFFQNVALEQGFTTDTLIFILADECWGRFYIDASGEELTLSDDPTICSTGLKGNEDDKIHGGSTITTLDLNNDGAVELLYGDATNPHIICAKNGGNTLDAWMTDQDTQFPSYDTPVYIPDFASVFHLDLDGDGIKDLIASPNLPLNGPDYESAWFYKNTATNEDPYFELQQKDFLIDEMIDLGTGAAPAFVDYNADGLMDLVVGNDNRWQQNLLFQPSLFLFENTGTAEQPSFQLVNDNWLNFKTFGTSAYAFAPAFGDLDNDGDPDLVVGERFGTLFYAENTAGAGNPVAFGPIQQEWMGIDVGQFATPAIADLNYDGLPDLIIGERNGNLNFFPNQGSSGSPAFHPNPEEAPNNSFLGQVNTADPGEVTGSSSPAILELNAATYILTGTQSGHLELYIVDEINLSSPFALQSGKWGEINLGKITHPAIADLNNDQIFELVVGNFRGGMDLYTTNLATDGTTPARETAADMEIELFPNPVKNILHINTPQNNFQEINYRIYNSTGQLLQKGFFKDKTKIKLQTTALPDGIYFLEIIGRQNKWTKRFVKT